MGIGELDSCRGVSVDFDGRQAFVAIFDILEDLANFVRGKQLDVIKEFEDLNVQRSKGFRALAKLQYVGIVVLSNGCSRIIPLQKTGFENFGQLLNGGITSANFEPLDSWL